MTPLGGTDRRLLLFRGADRPDFSEREKAMLALARPHISVRRFGSRVWSVPRPSSVPA
jgi:hypothetical protein